MRCERTLCAGVSALPALGAKARPGPARRRSSERQPQPSGPSSVLRQTPRPTPRAVICAWGRDPAPLPCHRRAPGGARPRELRLSPCAGPTAESRGPRRVPSGKWSQSRGRVLTPSGVGGACWASRERCGAGTGTASPSHGLRERCHHCPWPCAGSRGMGAAQRTEQSGPLPCSPALREAGTS